MTSDRMRAAGYVLARLAPSVLLASQHGWGKLTKLSTFDGHFPDPLHVGAKASLVLTIFGELVCPIAVALGLFTRLAAIPPFITMLVAAVVVHAGDPFAKRELALFYGAAFLVVALLGPGPWSLDARLRRRT